MNPNLTTAIEFKCKQCNDLSFKNIVYIENDKYAIICKNCIKKHLKEDTFWAARGAGITEVIIEFDSFNDALFLSNEELLKLAGEELSPKYYKINKYYGQDCREMGDEKKVPAGEYYLHSKVIILNSSLYHGAVALGMGIWDEKVINKFISKRHGLKYAGIFNCNELDLHKILDEQFEFEQFKIDYSADEAEEMRMAAESGLSLYYDGVRDGTSEDEIEQILIDDNTLHDKCNEQVFDDKDYKKIDYDIDYYEADRLICKYTNERTGNLYKDVKNFLEWKKKKGY